MKIAIGSDHAGFDYKRELIAQLRAKGHDVTDVGTDSEAPVSYVPFIREVAEGVAAGKFDRGVVLGGSGNDAINIAQQGPRARANCGTGRDIIRLNGSERRRITNCEVIYVLRDR